MAPSVSPPGKALIEQPPISAREVTEHRKSFLQPAPSPLSLVGVSAGRQVVNPLVVLIRSQSGMADRLLAEHADDGSGRCRTCSAGAQTGRYRWPCAIQRAAVDANEPDGVGGDTAIGGVR
jgi:hypothetical protein